MKAIILLAFGCLAIVGAQRRFYATPFLAPAESVATGGVSLRTLAELRDYLGLSENFNFVPEGVRRSSSGVKRVRLRQTFNGIDIRVATLTASQDHNEFYTGIVSGYCPTIASDFDTRPSQSIKRLQRALVDYVNENDNVDEIPRQRNKIKHLQNFHYAKQIYIDSNGQPVLAYFVSALIDRPLANAAYIRYPRVLFRADNRTAIIGKLRVDKCQAQTTCPRATGGNSKSGYMPYSSKCREFCLNASVKKGNICVLGNDMVRVKSTGFSWDRSSADLVEFDCDVGLGIDKAPAVDAFYYSQVFYDVLQDWGRLERTEREPHILYVDFGDGYSNSFWDGRSTTFGGGHERTYAFAIPEIIGHEMCHAVTDSLGNLAFDLESDAVSEAFSDICGKAVSYYVKGSNVGWSFAYDVMRNPNKALRYFDDPTRDGSTIAHIDQYTAGLDGYTAVGIYLKAFYSIVQEHSVSFRDAFEAFVHANQIYWNEETGFFDGACGVLRSASDLGLDKSAFTNGFDSVGISLGFCDISGTEDHIMYHSGETRSHVTVRHAQVSSSRRASYRVSSDSHSSVRVTISCDRGVDVTMQSSCSAGSVITSQEMSHSFPLSAGTAIDLYSDCHEITDITVIFEFE